MAQLEHFVENTAKRLGVLAKTGWLSRQSDDFQTLIARLGRWREFKAGETLYLAGEESGYLVGLAEGIFEITFPLVSDEPVVVHRAEPGFWTGEACVLPGQVRILSIAAATKVRVFVLPASSIQRMLSEDARHWAPFFELSLANSGTAVTLLAEALALSPRARVARILLRLAGPDGGVQGSQEDLGRLLGMTRSSVRRALTSLIEIGAVEGGYGRLSVRDRAALERLTHEA
jgi:CRP-like cAMP-binding protein